MDNKKFTSIAKEYKSNVASRYMSVGNEEITSKIRESSEYLLSVKYDGHFYLLCLLDKKIFFINPGGNVIDDLPILKQTKNILEKSSVKEAVFAGELYFKKEGRSRVFDLTANLKSKPENINFAVYDVLSIDDKSFEPKEFLVKQAKIDSIFNTTDGVHSLGSNIVKSRKDIQGFYKQTVETDHQEGVIVKSSEGMIYKIKPLCHLDAVVIGYVEREGERSGSIREILVAMIKDNNFHITAKIGNGFSDDERKSLFDTLKLLKTNSDYIVASGAKVAFTMVKPEMVIEYSCIDLISETSKGSIKRMVLSHDKEGYKLKQKSPSVSSMSPVFIRIRDDKKVDKNDIRFSQITDLIEISDSKEIEKLEKSKLIKREVYVKESKGMKMVRKFMIWKTNKEKHPNYPAYVFHYTDFSPSRKDMLKKDVKVSDSQKQIEETYAKEKESNVKKGWERV